jgi:hypothetical protein
MFSPSAWYWLPYVLLRRAGFVLTSVLLVQETSVRFMVFLLLNFVSLQFHTWIRPFGVDFINNVDTLSYALLVLVSSLLTAYLPPYSVGLQAVIFILIVPPALLWGLWVVRGQWQNLAERSRARHKLKEAQKVGKDFTEATFDSIDAVSSDERGGAHDGHRRDSIDEVALQENPLHKLGHAGMDARGSIELMSPFGEKVVSSPSSPSHIDEHSPKVPQHSHPASPSSNARVSRRSMLEMPPPPAPEDGSAGMIDSIPGPPPFSFSTEPAHSLGRVSIVNFASAATHVSGQVHPLAAENDEDGETLTREQAL